MPTYFFNPVVTILLVNSDWFKLLLRSFLLTYRRSVSAIEKRILHRLIYFLTLVSIFYILANNQVNMSKLYDNICIVRVSFIITLFSVINAIPNIALILLENNDLLFIFNIMDTNWFINP